MKIIEIFTKITKKISKNIFYIAIFLGVVLAWLLKNCLTELFFSGKTFYGRNILYQSIFLIFFSLLFSVPFYFFLTFWYHNRWIQKQGTHLQQIISRFSASKKYKQYLIIFLFIIFAGLIIVWFVLSKRAISSMDILNIGLYILLCVSSIFCGLGILSLLRLKIGGNKYLLIAPIISITLLILFLIFSITVKIPVSKSYIFIWIIFISLAIYGLIKNKKYLAKRNKWLLAGCVLLPLFLVAFPYWYGSATKFGDILPDGWLYITVGQYLWKYPLGTQGGLSPLYQSASGLISFRITSSAFMAFLSLFFPNQDTARASGIYLAWVIFVFTCSCGFFIADKNLSKRKKILYVILVIFSGWTWDILWATNYDNLLVLAFVPVLIEMVANQNYSDLKWAGLIGGISAASVMAYPEYGGIITILLLILIVVRICRSDQSIRKTIFTYVLVIGAVFLIFLAPLSTRIYSYIQIQLNGMAGNITQIGKPGAGMFEGLIIPKCVPSAFLGMGCELMTIAPAWLYVGETITTDFLLPAKNNLALVLSFLVILGILRVIQKKRWIDLVPLILVIPISYMLLHESYSYAAYKFIVLLWWLIPYLLVSGIDFLQNYFHTYPGLIFVLVYFPILLFLVNTTFRISYVALSKTAFLQSDYVQIRDVPIVKQNTPILVDVNDWLSSEWANYYLRDQDSFLLVRKMYMVWNPEVMDQAMKIDPSEIHYILSDNAPANIPVINKIWTGKPYSIWELSPNWQTYVDIDLGK